MNAHKFIFTSIYSYNNEHQRNNLCAKAFNAIIFLFSMGLIMFVDMLMSKFYMAVDLSK